MHLTHERQLESIYTTRIFTTTSTEGSAASAGLSECDCETGYRCRKESDEVTSKLLTNDVNQNTRSDVYPTMMLTNGENPAVITVDFESFYIQTGKRMLSLAYSLTGSWSEAEDLVQEAYTAAHRKWNVVGSYSDPTAWVRRVVTNAAISRWRRLGRELNVRQRLAARADLAATEPEPASELFLAAVGALPRQQRAVVVLHYSEDQSVDAIAALLGCSAGTVKTQLFRARRTLADRLGAQIEEEHDA